MSKQDLAQTYQKTAQTVESAKYAENRPQYAALSAYFAYSAVAPACVWLLFCCSAPLEQLNFKIPPTFLKILLCNAVETGPALRKENYER